MAINVTNPQDMTGAAKIRLEAEAAEKQKDARSRMAMSAQKATALKEGTIDLTAGETVIEPDEDSGEPIVVAERTKKLRVNIPLEDVTIGHGTNYTFEPGQRYKVPGHVYDYLDAKGFVWH